MTTTIALFTRDLRIHDSRIAATRFASPPRQRFLAETLADLDTALRTAGARLIVRTGDVVEQVCRIASQVNAAHVHLSTDVSAYARARQTRLRAALGQQRRQLRCHDEVHTIVAPGRIAPQRKDHFAVFTPYHRRWQQTPWRSPLTAPHRLALPPDLDPGADPTAGCRRDERWPGGETEARRRAHHWLRHGLARYHDDHDDLNAEGTSRLSPYLHFGCLSPLELATRAAEHEGEGTEAFVRQLAWRDFHHQVLAARPAAAQGDYRPRGDAWREDDQALQAWKDGQTGIPIIDAGMRQLRAEGWMHNRARLITGSFLTKTLYLDWRHGAQHFFDHLLDGDLANNCLNWQWVAGTGTDTRPNRVLNPLRQAERYDPHGAYVRRFVPELADLDKPQDIHQPWRCTPAQLRSRGYPPPIVDLDQARDRFRDSRQLASPPEQAPQARSGIASRHDPATSLG
jgi:deoxyribodipyrimidine photo-lyase